MGSLRPGGFKGRGVTTLAKQGGVCVLVFGGIDAPVNFIAYGMPMYMQHVNAVITPVYWYFHYDFHYVLCNRLCAVAVIR